MKTKHWIAIVLYVLIGIPLIFVVWSKAAGLLNAPSDLSVLLGCLLIFATLVFMSLSAYLIVMRCGGQETNGCDDKGQELLKDFSPKKLFSETINSVEYQKGRTNDYR